MKLHFPCASWIAKNIGKLWNCLNMSYGSKQYNLFIHFSSTHFPMKTFLNCLDVSYESKWYNPFIHSFILQAPIFQSKCCQIAWMCLMDQSNRIHSSICPYFKHSCSNLDVVKLHWSKPYGSKQYDLFIHFSSTNFPIQMLWNCFDIDDGSKQYYPFIHCPSTHFPI
jgi:hypothetical protein